MFLPLKKGENQVNYCNLNGAQSDDNGHTIDAKGTFPFKKKSLATKKAIPCMTSVLVYVSIHGSIVKNWINLAKSKPGLEEILTEFQRKINKEKNFYC